MYSNSRLVVASLLLSFLVKIGLLRIVVMATKAEDFFPDINGNLTKITWAHAVNNQTLLEEALNSSVMMLEADVIYGKLNGQGDDIPIMGHPPATQSDLSLEDFLTTVDDFNQSDNSSIKGVKLDFKTIEVFTASIDIINKLYKTMDYPIWVNADIISGPLNATNTPVNAVKFLTGSKQFTKSVLSIGWTTNYGQANNISEAQYTEDQIKQMLDVIEMNGIEQDITFPVRAGIAAESIPQMKNLIKTVKNSTLTIWSSADDSVNVEQLRKLIFEIGLDKIYVDVPEELKNQLHLDQSGARMASATFCLLFLIISSFFI